jgi:hypothetical protein
VVGSIGIDVQAARAAACLLEWPDQATGGAARQGAIGDGRRLLIPVATATDDAGEGRWGSAAAEEVLSRLTADGAGPTAGTAAGLAPALLAWQGEPWSEEFLGGLRQRLLRYLGLPESGPVRGHQLLFCADPGPDGDWPGATHELLEGVGLPDAELLRPANALLCRWLAGDPDLSRPRTVLAVACGETATDLGLYAVQAAQDAVSRVGTARVAAGARGWLADLAAQALGFCRPDTPARALLSLLDGADEFAAALRAAPPEAAVEWSGPLSQHMFEPFRASRAELARHPAVTSWIVPVADAATQLARGAAGPVTVLVGGPGATWPFAADVLGVTLGPTARDGGVWGSGDPALDLAFGACWWPLFKRSFGRVPAITPVALALPPTRQETVPPWADQGVTDRDRAAEQPPWADDGADDRESPADQVPWAVATAAAADEPPNGPSPWEATLVQADEADLPPWER